MSRTHAHRDLQTRAVCFAGKELAPTLRARAHQHAAHSDMLVYWRPRRPYAYRTSRTRYDCLQKGTGMHLRRFFCLVVVLCVATPAMAQPGHNLHAHRLADKLWWVIEITKEYQPQFQAHVTLEAPDGERLALTLQGERARTLVHNDVIALAPKPGVPAD